MHFLGITGLLTLNDFPIYSVSFLKVVSIAVEEAMQALQLCQICMKICFMVLILLKRSYY
jgi:hypothetical protein